MNNCFENHKYDGFHYISCNDIYEYFGYPSTQDGQTICWIFGENEETVDMTNELDDCKNTLMI